MTESEMQQKGAAIVTGANRGIGLAVALKMAELGWPLMLLARDADALEQATRRCAALGAPVQWRAGDLTSESFMTEAVAATLSEYGSVDALVNNAGTAVQQRVQDADLDRWRQVMQINFDSAVFLSHAVLPQMIARQSGCIINISSISGRNTPSGSAIYSASKHALNGFTGCLFEDVRDLGIKVSAIMPGFVATDLTRGVGLEETNMIQPEDVAEAVAYVLGASASCCPTEIVLRPQRTV